MEYYGVRIIYNRDIFCIWVADESGDRLFTCSGRILTFTDEKTLKLYCDKEQIHLEEKECTVENIPALSEVKEMLKKKDRVQFCKVLLDLWNLALDINNSFDCNNPYLNGCRHLYDKVFWGNNLEVFTCGRQLYVPHFSKKDRRQIKLVLDEIYATFEKRLPLM